MRLPSYRRSCYCGCGGEPVADGYLPGHDQKHNIAMLDWLKDNRPEVWLKALNEGRKALRAKAERERSA